MFPRKGSEEPIAPTPYADLNQVLRELIDSVQAVLADQFVGAYLHGSFAVGDFDLPSVLQLLQQGMAHALPHSGSLPVPQASPAGHHAAAAHLLGQHLPTNTTLQDEEDAGEGCPIGNAAWPARLEA